MDWVRIQPLLANWPGGGGPPSFEITADENGSAVVELAWDPQALAAPASYVDPLRYYATGQDFSANLTDDAGSARSISVPAQTIQLSTNRARWTMPQALWDGYVQESLKTLRNPPTTTFSRNLYYRVRVTPPGGTTARVWPTDDVLTGAGAAFAPHLGILPISASPSSQVVPDQMAVNAMGGIPLIAPNAWGAMLTWLWQNLPESDPSRQALVAIFAHTAFQGADVPTRAKLLNLWLFGGPTVRPRLPELLGRNVVVGSNLTQSAITKTDYRGGATLVDNLLSLLEIVPHPDVVTSHARNIPFSKEQLLDDVIDEILDPNGQSNQGEADTCTTTSIQTLLVTVNPAEYARLQLGLLSAAGQVVMADGTTVTVPPGIFQIDTRYPNAQSWAFFVRNASELAFQATVLKLGKGNTFPAYDPTVPPNAPTGINTVFQATVRGGLFQDQMVTALHAVFNAAFATTSITMGHGATGASILSQSSVNDALFSDLPNREQPLVIVMGWGAPLGSPGSGLHAVLAVRTDSGRLFFKNPQYPGWSPPPGVLAGGNASNPPRRYEDPSGAIESMTSADLATWLVWFHEPTQALI